MITITTAGLGFLMMIGLMFLGLHVATVMFAVSLLGAWLYLGDPIVNAFGNQMWGSMDDTILLSIPLYILVGEILVRGGATDRMYKALSDWLSRLPGGLLHTNIGASALFSAVSGSSVATAATISTVALPAFKGRNYDQKLVLGTIAAGASLGNLIPPGIALIIYGAMTNTSVGRLYAGAVVPGLIMTGIFMLTIVIISLSRRDLAASEEKLDPLPVRLRRLTGLLAPCFIFAVIMGSIYTGWATPTESAALAVILSLPIAALHGKLSVSMLHQCFLATVCLTSMSILILAVAFYLNFVMGLLGVTQALSGFVASLGTTQMQLLFVLLAFYLILGVFFETLPMLVGTVPIVFPLVASVGVDPVWFGVFIVLMCEISLISPPVGMTLYVIQAVRREGSINDVFLGTLPFFASMIVMAVLMILWPEMVLWLPRLTFG